jgi:hypothetical protein
MQLTLRDAAILLDLNPRTLRARALRGDVPGTKTAKGWTFDHRQLPLTDAQRARIQHRADALRDVVEAAVPGRLAVDPDPNHRGLLDLDAFRLGLPVLTALRAAPDRAAAADALQAALLDVAEAAFVYDRLQKLAALNRARASLGRCVAHLLLAPPVDAAIVHALEHTLQPAINGYARWAASLGERPRR